MGFKENSVECQEFGRKVIIYGVQNFEGGNLGELSELFMLQNELFNALIIENRMERIMLPL